ncbi:YdcF family protein [Myxococcus sp. K38C18041901]|uniref:YdcF family protein n=1 Tax=Myxococcus guangdongensis TaxID=2906760 RepID=UPI0020A75A35|nr:ElyC/SanA/YdcF family protein [Myxococcus guangdongensis]MCP3057800.1 YdcF family protein [Myxococcus guangdongensis]
MFLFLSKVLDLFLAPLTWALLFLLVSRLPRLRPALARGLLVTGLLVLYVFSTEAMSTLLTYQAEEGAHDTFQPGEPYDAVIVLGGGLDPSATERSGRLEFNAAPERILQGFDLVREGHARFVLISGGSLDPRPTAVVEADVLSRMLQAWGIPAERIVTEGKSRNTRENAVESARIIQERGWKRLLLVTSAAHMPRAQGCFAAVGLRPDTLPVDARMPAFRMGRLGWLPRAGALSQSTDVLRELAGRVVYRLRGWTAP